MIYDIKNIYQILILFGLIIMPVLSFTEITTLMYGVSTHNALLSPWYIKGIKDFIFILIILIGIFWMIRYKYRLRIDITLYMLYFLILVSMILSLILLTAIIKNSTKKIDEDIFILKENLRSLKNEFENMKLEFEFLSSSERLLDFQKSYFEDKLVPKDINEIEVISKNSNQLQKKKIKIISE